MRRLTSLLILVPCLAIVSCGDDEMPLFMDILYQMRCDDAGGCSNVPMRNVNNLNGEEGFTLRCNLTAVPGAPDTRNLTFSADQSGEEGFFFELRNVRYTAGGGGPVMGTSCQATVREQGLTYSGDCGSATPTPQFPCRVQISSEETTMDGPTIFGEIFCQGLAAEADMTITRELTAAGTDPGVRDMAAPFRIVNCPGL